MMLFQQSAALGERLFRRRKMLPLFLFLSGLFALLVARPFTVTADSFFFSAACLLISAAGWIVCLLAVGYVPAMRAESCRTVSDDIPESVRSGANGSGSFSPEEKTDDDSMPVSSDSAFYDRSSADSYSEPDFPVAGDRTSDAVNFTSSAVPADMETVDRSRVCFPNEVLYTEGMYSVVRHPLYIGLFLMWLGFMLYVGVDWYLVGGVLFYFFCMEKIIFAEESRLAERFGEPYRLWSEHTNTFIPNRKAWRKPAGRFALGYALRQELRSLFFLLLAFVVVHVVKIRIIEFRWDIAPFWLGVGLVSLLMVLILKRSRK